MSESLAKSSRILMEPLRTELMGRALALLQSRHPTYVGRFREVVSSGGTYNAAHEAVAAIPTPTFQDWANIFRLLFEVDLAAYRAGSALRQLASVPSEESLTSLGMTLGAWVDYQRIGWLVHESGMLERAAALTKRLYRKWIQNKVKRAPAPDQLLQPIEEMQAKVDRFRNTEVHALEPRGPDDLRPSVGYLLDNGGLRNGSCSAAGFRRRCL